VNSLSDHVQPVHVLIYVSSLHDCTTFVV